MAYSINLDRTALILVEAIFFGDAKTAKRWQLSPTTIQRYRKRLNLDSDLAQLVAIKKHEFESNWIEEMPAALRVATRFLITAFQELDPSDPTNVHAVAGAMKILSEIGLAKELVDARLGKFNIPEREADNEMVGRLPESSTS